MERKTPVLNWYTVTGRQRHLPGPVQGKCLQKGPYWSEQPWCLCDKKSQTPSFFLLPALCYVSIRGYTSGESGLMSAKGRKKPKPALMN